MRFENIDYNAMRDSKHYLKDCFEKEFSYMTALTAEWITFEVPELKIKWEAEPVREVMIKDSIFTTTWSSGLLNAPAS